MLVSQQQQQHIRDVMRLAAGDAGMACATEGAHRPDGVILDSWVRCLNQYKLDPTRAHEAVILPSERVREHRDRLEEFLRIARHGLESLYTQIAGMGYCVLLTDARGVTVDFIGDIQLDPSLRRAGLYLGSDWNEEHAGTCGVGTAITTGRALTVHQADHFDAAHIPLTCTAVPLHDPLGRLVGVLDISALTSPRTKSSQHWAMQFLQLNARQVENANFLRWFREDWVVKVHPSPEFVEINPECLLALDAAGRIIGHNRTAQRLLEQVAGTTVLGLPFERFFGVRFDDLGNFQRSADGRRSAVALQPDGRTMYLQAAPPPVAPPRSVAGATQPARPLQPALARLSGGDPQLDRQIQRASRLADAPVNLLLGGETGSGKEYFARALHEASGRAAKPFVAVNCAAIPEALIESELFGHLPGSFSGAMARGKRGLVLEADGGTLFLDEIGDMPLGLQPRLLRVLAEREVLPVGAARPLVVDVRVIAASHVDLRALTGRGGFREDLYYRLAGAELALPPLRERADLGWLIDRMLGEHHAGIRISPQARSRLLGWHWPGNLRELRNALAYACALCEHGVVELQHLPDSIAASPWRVASPGGQPPLPADARRLLQELRAAGGNISRVAQALGLSRMTVYRRMRRWGIEPAQWHS